MLFPLQAVDADSEKKDIHVPHEYCRYGSKLIPISLGLHRKWLLPCRDGLIWSVPNPGYFHSPSSLPKLSVSLKSPGKMF
jgi:hypothetical protein